MLKKGLMLLVLALVFIAACSGPNEKKMRFYASAKKFMDNGDLVKAGLEAKNAIQIDPKYSDAHNLLGQVELRKGHFPQAMASFVKAAELDPGNLDTQVELGKLFLLQGSADKAQEKANLVLKANPGHSEGLLLQGGIHVAREEWSKGAGLLQRIIVGGVTKPDAYLMLAMARSGLKDLKGGEEALVTGARQNPSSVSIQKSLADLYAKSGRVDAAAASIRRMIELEPSNYGYGLTLAGLFWDNGRQSEGREILGKLVSTHSKNEACLIALAAFYLARRQPDEAEQVLKAGIHAISHSSGLRLALSELYNSTGRSGEAVTLLKEHLGQEKDLKKPEMIQARNLLARIYFMRGELPEAERNLAQILSLSPGNLEATYIKGRIHLQKKEGGAAVSAFRAIVNDRPKEAEGYLLLADAHLINRDPNLARESLQQAERLEPDSLLVNTALARLSIEQKEYRLGEERMERYLAKHPENQEARIELGDLYRMAGAPRRAEAEYNSVKRRAPKSAVPYLRLGELFAKQGDVARAISEMETVVKKLATGNLQPALVLANLYTRAARPSKARELFEELFARYPKEWQVANDFACFLADYGNSRHDLERARLLAKEVAAQRPDDPYILDTLGWTEYRSGNYAKALELLEKANLKLVGHQTVSFHLGMANFQAGKKERARIYLDKALAGGDFSGRQEAGKTLKLL